MGGGCPDILVAFFGRLALVEIKNGEKPPSARRLTDDQVKFWNGWKSNPRIVKNLDEVRECVEGLEREIEMLRRAV